MANGAGGTARSWGSDVRAGVLSCQGVSVRLEPLQAAPMTDRARHSHVQAFHVQACLMHTRPRQRGPHGRSLMR